MRRMKVLIGDRPVELDTSTALGLINLRWRATQKRLKQEATAYQKLVKELKRKK